MNAPMTSVLAVSVVTMVSTMMTDSSMLKMADAVSCRDCCGACSSEEERNRHECDCHSNHVHYLHYLSGRATS